MARDDGFKHLIIETAGHAPPEVFPAERRLTSRTFIRPETGSESTVWLIRVGP